MDFSKVDFDTMLDIVGDEALNNAQYLSKIVALEAEITALKKENQELKERLLQCSTQFK